MALNLLIADADDKWLGEVKKYFSGFAYDVTTVNNGKEAQLALYNQKFYAVIINVEIKNHPILQVLKFISRHYPNQRIVVLVNDNNLLAAEDLNEEKLAKLGVLKTFTKPWELSSIKEMLDDYQSLEDIVASVVKTKETSAEESMDIGEGQLSKVKFDEFFSHKIVLFDVLIKSGEGKFTRIFKSGDPFNRERFEKYKGQAGQDFIYFNSNDRRKFVQYNNFLAKSLIPNQSIACISKVNLLKNVCEKIWEDIYSIGLKAQHIEQSREWSEALAMLVNQQDDLYKILLSYQRDESCQFTKTFLVALYTVSMIKQFDWQSKSTMESAGLACLFHDIGKISLSKELFFLSPSQLNSAQIEQYKKHPELGVKMLESFRGVNNSIKQIILQHHEAYDGSGFPFAKKGSNILMLANILLVANDFIHTMVDQNLAPTEAARKILVNDEKARDRYYPMMAEKLVGIFSSSDKLNKDIIMPVQSKKEKKSA